MVKMKPEEKEAAKKYDFLAESYPHLRTKKNRYGWFYNEWLEMPAMLYLMGNVKGKKILDFGCGSGIYAKFLTKKGAKVKGFDISKSMLVIAKRENPNLDLRLGSGYKFPFKEKFDIVQGSLVLDYLKDWDKVFKEVKRVLKNKGIFVFSIGNPVSEVAKKVFFKGKKLRVLGINNYFNEKVLYANWNFEDLPKVKMPYHHKTYETIINTIFKNGFEVTGYKDTSPSRVSKKYFPKEYKICAKIPYFCVWKVRKK